MKKEHHDTIHTDRNLEKACSTLWHLRRRFQYERFGVNLRTERKIRKELEASNGDYDGTAVRKIHTDRSDCSLLVRLHFFVELTDSQ